MSKKTHTWEWIYTTFWCLLLLGAAFPCIFTHADFSFLSDASGDNAMQGVSKSYLFAVVMIVVLHLLDVTHLVISTKDILPEKLRKGFLCTLISVMLIAISLIGITVVDGQTLKVILFIVFWVLLFTYKLLSVKIICPETDGADIVSS